MVYTGSQTKKSPKSRSNILYFPENLKTSASKTDCIHFRFYKTTGAFDQGDQRGRFDNFTEYLVTNDNNSTIDTYSTPPTEKAALGYPTIYLYMPEDISTTFKSNWEGTAIDAFTESFLRGSTSFKAGTEEFLTTAQGQGWAEGAARIIARAIEKTGTKLSGDDIFSLRGGVVTNPNVELLFKQQELRTFQLKFKFTPTNENESIDTLNIIKTFRRASLPKFGAVGDISSPDLIGPLLDKIPGADKNIGTAAEEDFITVPNLCLVTFLHKGKIHPYLPSYNVCAITDVKINYTPDNRYATFKDGEPIATELTLGFLETKLQFSQNIY